MDKRISRDELHMEIAILYSKRATCKRGGVGAVAIKDKRVIASGYNGPAPGSPHCSDDTCDINSPCKRAIHAEANLIAFCAKFGIPLMGATLFVTSSPCLKCAELIIQSGISEVVYKDNFRDISGLKLLFANNIKITVYEDSIQNS